LNTVWTECTIFWY